MDHIPLFSTHVFVFENPEYAPLNEAVSAELLKERDAHPGVVHSNVGGWHSVPDLSQRNSTVLDTLMRMAINHVRQCCVTLAGTTSLPPYQYRVQGWGMVMEDGDYNIIHDNRSTDWYLVYDVDVEEADLEKFPQSGVISFIDPRRGQFTVPGVPLEPSTFNIFPKTGMMIVFPGWLQHYVHSYRGTRPRISISCNIDVVTNKAPHG